MYYVKDSWGNGLNLWHTTDRIYLTSILCVSKVFRQFCIMMMMRQFTVKVQTKFTQVKYCDSWYNYSHQPLSFQKINMEKCSKKLDEFLAKLPPAKVAIERWRSSTGVQMKHNSTPRPQRAVEHDVMSAEEKKKGPTEYLTSSEQAVSATTKYPVGLVLSAPRLTDASTWRAMLSSPASETLALRHHVLDQNSVEELINCRYLRVNSNEQLVPIMVE